MVTVLWPRWMPCPYMVKTFKNLSPERMMACGWIFAQIIEDRRSTKVVKIMVVHWHLTFLGWGQVCFPMHLYGKNVENFKRPPLKPQGQYCLNFIWSLPWAGEWKITKMVVVHWPRWLPCPYMIKTFKSSSLEERMPSGWIFQQIIGDWRSTKVAKIMIVHWPLTFLRRGLVPFRMHLYGLHTFVWKKCW